MRLSISLVLFLALISFVSYGQNQDSKEKACCSDWEQLLDTNLTKWEPWLGVPHKASGIPGYEDVENVRTGGYKSLGLCNTNNVFSVIQENGEDVLKITGEIFGSLMSRQEYENYHLKFQVKWGEKLWEPMLTAKRNNGLLYHSIGEPGKGLWGTWMTCLEYEVENTNYGDLITIDESGRVKAKCPAVVKDGKYYFESDAPLVDFGRPFKNGRCFKSQDREKPLGEWTTVELICFGDMSLHIIEGEVVMAVYQPRHFDGENWVPMTKGKLQIQSEGSETFFKNIQIKSIDKLEERYQKYLR